MSQGFEASPKLQKLENPGLPSYRECAWQGHPEAKHPGSVVCLGPRQSSWMLASPLGKEFLGNLHIIQWKFTDPEMLL